MSGRFCEKEAFRARVEGDVVRSTGLALLVSNWYMLTYAQSGGGRVVSLRLCRLSSGAELFAKTALLLTVFAPPT